MQALCVLCLCGNIKLLNHIGKEKYFARVVFLYPFYSVPYECILKEGDRMGHKDDVLMDNSLYLKKERTE